MDDVSVLSGGASQEKWPGRYAAVAYDCYYPSGGVSDIQGRFATQAEAKAFLNEYCARYDFREVHDLLKQARTAWNGGEPDGLTE